MSLLLLFRSDPAGPISGTVSVTEADDTVAAAAGLALGATASIAEAADTVSALATLAIKGTLSASLANATLAATAAPALTGAASVTAAGDSVSSSAALAIKGTVGVIQTDDIVAATGGTGAIAGSLGATLADVTVSSSVVLAEAPIVIAHGGGRDDREDYERWLRNWQDDLRSTIDQAWKIANGEIDPLTLEPMPPADLAGLTSALELIEAARDQAAMDAFMAEETRLQEEEAIAMLLLAA
jgi:hypothetical protein